MPRGPRLDAPGTLHHVIVRGIEKRRIVDDDRDRERFAERLGGLASETRTAVCAWAGRVTLLTSCTNCNYRGR